MDISKSFGHIILSRIHVIEIERNYSYMYMKNRVLCFFKRVVIFNAFVHGTGKGSESLMNDISDL